jgi:hypothetical protein
MSQSTIKLVDFNDGDDGVVFVLQAASTEQLANEITAYFRSREYRLESGTALNGIWGTGNAFLRAMFGGMIKRHKFQLTSEGPPSSTKLKVSNRMGVASGGLIGLNPMKEEAGAITQGLKAHFGFVSHPE